MARSIAVLSVILISALIGPAWAVDRDISDLFDPAVIARSICNVPDAPRPPAEQLAALPDAKKKDDRPPIWPGLGTLTWKISTASPEAQAYFDQGLRLTYGFNHGEAIRAFRAALALDPKCAICAWGESLNYGSNINGAMGRDDNKPAFTAMRRAQSLLTPQTPPKERALIEALATRYVAKSAKNRDKLDAAYADAMKKAYQAFPDDPDIAISFIEAAMVASPFPWFERRTNVPQGGIAAAVAATERLLAADPHHPGAIHYYIHLAEQPMPEKAEPYANELAALMPGAGHMVHMPSHIFLRLGRYKDSLQTNLAAVESDEKLFAAVPDSWGGYRYGLYPHNIHMAMTSASMAGDAKHALAMQAKMLESDTHIESYLAATFEPVLRFQDPAVTLARPAPDKDMALVQGIWRYARGSAFAWQKNLADARTELKALMDLRAKLVKKQGKKLGANGTELELAEVVLQGRIAIAEGNLEAARGLFEAAVAIQERDTLYRGDPPPWDTPMRHALGLLLMKMGHTAEAIPLLRQALIDTPNNAWTLYALKEASARTGDTLGAEQYGKLFEKAWLGEGTPDLDRI